MERRPATPDEAKALANPLRLRILRLCLDEGLTNKELAEQLGRDPGTILHHVRLLVTTGFLAPEEVRRGRRSALERPYRATGKSWTLDIGDEAQGTLAMIDAFRQEVAESDPAHVGIARLGVRLRPSDLAEIEVRIKELIDEAQRRDASDGIPIGLFIGSHRRAGGRGAGPAGLRTARVRRARR